MINKFNDDSFKKVFDGVEIKTTVHGKQSLMTEFRLKAGSSLPSHSHVDFEQTGVLISGKMIICIGGEKTKINPGDSWCIGAGVEHSAEILEDAVAIEVFSYPREDYLKLLDPASR